VPGRAACSFKNPSRFWNQQSFYTFHYYSGIQSLHHFVETFYSDIISLNVPGETEPYCISGLNTQETPLQITWTVEADTLPGVIDTLIPVLASQCTPYLICGYTSCLEIRGGRQITLIN
jgi:hypothetical protein